MEQIMGLQPVKNEFLKQLRKMKGKTLDQVSYECGLSTALICKLENGTTNMSDNARAVLSEYYGVELDKNVLPYKKKFDKLKEEKEALEETNLKLIIENRDLTLENKQLKKLLSKIGKRAYGIYKALEMYMEVNE